ncbi:MAG: hypothetical protein AAFX76_00745 [Planctomycetota bacterium]
MAQGDARRGGSAIVLAIVTIVMMCMLGAAYLQMARIDRRTAAAVDTRTNLDEASILRYIGQVLAGDVPRGTASTAPEVYDYPWSDAAGVLAVDDVFSPIVIPGPAPNFNNGDLPTREPRLSSGLNDAAGNQRAQISDRDDAWLASTEPDPTTLLWPHITNLRGVFLDLDPTAFVADPADPTGPAVFPLQYLSTADNNVDSGDTGALTAVATANPAVDAFKFADADGDGIYDSRWTWAPLPSDDGLAFVMAVRIIDNSSLLDLNTWAYDRVNQAASPNDNSPRWLWPGELDLESSLAMVQNRAGVGAVTAQDVLTNGAPTGRNLPGATYNTLNGRLYNWLDASAVWRSVNRADTDILNDWTVIGSGQEQNGSSTTGEATTQPPGTNYNRYSVRQNEVELRWRNGVTRATPDNSGQEPDAPIEGLDFNLFRTDLASPPPLFDPETAWDNTGFSPELSFFFNEPRKMLTVISGSADYGRVNINEADIDELEDAFSEDIDYDRATASTDPNDPDPRLFVAGGWEDEDEFAEQAAAIVADFLDEDNEVTRQGDMYGMEYLPFISEVYVQGRYSFELADLVPGDAVAGTPTQATWRHAAGDYGAAIEIVNPWPWEIPLADVELFVDDGVGAPIDGSALQSWGTLQALTGRTTLAGHEQITIVRHDENAGNNRQETQDFIDNSNGIETQIAVNEDWPTGTDDDGVIIRLEAAASDGNRVLYQQVQAPEIPEEVIQTYDAAQPFPLTGGEIGYVQFTSLGTANGFNVMAVRDDEFDLDAYDVAPVPPLLTTSRTIHSPAPATTGATAQLDTASKGVAGLDNRVLDAADSGAAPTAGDEPWVIGNAERMYRSGDLLRVVFLGPRLDTVTGTALPIADVWHANFFADPTLNPQVAGKGILQEYRVGSAMLDLVDPGFDGDRDTDVAGNRNAEVSVDFPVSHAAFYLARFTTLDVNNGNGGLVAGRPNINTMPRRLLATALPFTTAAAVNTATPPGIASSPLTLSIINARENPNATAGGVAGTQGLQFPSQLAHLIPGIPAVPARFYDPNPANIANTRDEVVDFNEFEPNAGGADATHTTDTFSQDREEFTILLNYFNQVVATRSDIYTAYVLVRAYSASDFTNGTPLDPSDDVIDEFRLLAVFDRSTVNANGFPRILAVQRFEDGP